MKKTLFTVYVFSRLNTKRFFRDRLALFFGILFPLIFLFVFGGISGGNNSTPTINIALLNESKSPFAASFEKQLNNVKLFKVDKTIHSLSTANNKMQKGQLDGTVVLPPDFGTKKASQQYPSGQAQVVYTQNNQTAGQAITSGLSDAFKVINSALTKAPQPFSAVAKPTTNKSLTSFDYTFAGLLGFSIVGMGIFGPINVFPELKKQGILRRLHTTPLKVWQYFLSTMVSQALIGLISLAVMFLVAISVFHLKVVGNYFEIALFLVYSIVMILGIGLAIGGWAKNERQAAPLSNIVVFPMLFLSGTFFPRFAMPEWLQHVSAVLPLTPVIDGIRLLTTEGKHLVDLGAQLGLMGIWLIVIYIVAFRVFRWE